MLVDDLEGGARRGVERVEDLGQRGGETVLRESDAVGFLEVDEAKQRQKHPSEQRGEHVCYLSLEGVYV